MKTLYTSLFLCAFCFYVNAQTTWIGVADSNWSNAANWDTNAVPATSDDVVIPDGFTVVLNIVGNVKSINVQGTSQFNINTNFAFLEPSTFGVSTTVNWGQGSINGTASTLTNLGTLNLVSPNNKLLVGNIILNNSGTINMTTAGDLLISSGTLNNEDSGIIDMQVDNGNITSVGTINNAGLIKKTSIGDAFIRVLLNNTGTISAESGTLSFQSALEKNLTGGIYNVFSGAIINLESPMNISDELTGVINGDLNWSFNFNVNTTATFNFTGSGNVNWTTHELRGGGTLTNLGTLNLATGGQKTIVDNTTLNNLGIINYTALGNLYISSGILNNEIDGIINMQVDGGHIRSSGSGPHVLNNYGLIQRAVTTGIAKIYVELNNSGTIEMSSGTLEHTGELPFTNTETGIVKGIGVFDVPATANYINNGVFSPGLSPGVLTVQGDFTSSDTSVLTIDLDGHNQGTEYDLLAIEGDANFDGSVSVNLGFEPTLNDEFIIATTTGMISNCTINPAVSVTLNSTEYTLSVICRNQNELVLTVIDILGVDDFELESSLVVFPNPTSDDIVLKKNRSINLQKAVLMDILGKVISVIDLTTMQDQKRVSLSNYAKGIYLLQIHSEHNSITKQIIKQ